MSEKISIWLSLALLFAGVTLGILLISLIADLRMLWYISFIPLVVMLCCTIMYMIEDSVYWWMKW